MCVVWVCVVLHEFCQAVVDTMREYIAVPAGDRLHSIRDGFQSKWGFPQCIGAIDGTHIPIIAPKEHPLDYYNRKGYHSVLMQALVDDQYPFLDVYMGWPGSVHDVRVLGNSKLYQKCEAGTFLPSWKISFGNTDRVSFRKMEGGGGLGDKGSERDSAPSSGLGT